MQYGFKSATFLMNHGNGQFMLKSKPLRVIISIAAFAIVVLPPFICGISKIQDLPKFDEGAIQQMREN